jgi:hypothetical protein
MFGFVQNMFARASNPSASTSAAIVSAWRRSQPAGQGEFKLIAAASADVPNHVRHDPAGRNQLLRRDHQGAPEQRQVPQSARRALVLPASMMFIQHLRMPKLDADAMKKGLPWELRGKLPIDPSHALLRHIIAGDVLTGRSPRTK